MADRVGQQIGNYRLVRLLGEGGFAEVYLGEHLHLGTEAAIKILHAQLAADDVDQFRAEARIIARLEHPNIVRVLDFGLDGKTPFLVMSYAPNGTLRKLYPKGKQVPLAAVVSSVRQVADALQYAHGQKLIHRDVKPENMLVGRRNEILLSDFGIALVTQSSRYQNTRDVVGTAAYMSPEQIQGKPRPASDQYSLAVVVYEWLTGERPFRGSFTEIAVQHAVAPPPPLREKDPTISPEVERVVLSALAKDPLQRFATIQAFANALGQASQFTERTWVARPVQPYQPVTPTPAGQFNQDSQQTILATPLTSEVTPQSQWRQTTTPGARSDEVALPGRPFSRRLLLGGAIGLAALAGGGITWLALASQKSGNNSALHLSTTPPGAPVTGTTATAGGPTPTPTTSSPSPEVTNTPAAPRSIATPLLTYRGHSQYVYGVAWFSDQQHLASASLDTSVQIWSASSAQLFSSYHHPKSVNDVKASHNSGLIASASDDRTAQVRDMNATLFLTYSNHSSSVYTVEWSSDDTRIVTASADKTAHIWNANSGTTLQILSGHSDVVWAAGWSPDGQHVVTASADGTAKVWDAGTGAAILTYTGHTGVVRTVSWSPDGTRIATGSDDGTVQVWNASTGSTLLTYRGHLTNLRTVSWSHDGSRIVSGSRDATAQVWSPDSGRTLLIYRGHASTVFDAQWSRNDTLIASCSTDTTVQLWQSS